MGTKYVTESITGYNASPPVDDGSATEANKVKFSTTKEKLSDPIKDQVANIDAKLLLMADVGPDAKTTTYTTVAGDHQKTIECDGTFTVTLLAVASAPIGYTNIIKNIGSGTITVDATGTETIDGSTSTIALAAQESIIVQLNQAKTGYSTLALSALAGGALMDSEVDADIKTLVLPASTTISTFGRTIVDDANAAAVLTTLGVDTDVASLSLPASTTISTFGATLVDDADAATARATLGVGLGTGDLVSTNNLSDVTSAATSRTNLGITSGTWTPTIQDSSFSDGESQTYTTQYGSYTKIGNRVLISGHIQMNNLGTLTTSQTANIAGLPFTSSSTTNSEGTITVGNATGISITANASIVGQIQTNTSYIQCRNWDTAGGPSTLLLSELTSAGKLIFHGQYLTDA